MVLTKTWTALATLPASDLNTYIRDQLLKLDKRAIAVSFGDVSGVTLTTGVKGFLEIPWACTVTGWTLLADAAGSIVIDVWKDSWANFPPTVADTIAGSEKPTLSAVQKNQDTSLSTWTTTISAGDILGFNIDSVTTIKQASLILRVTLD